MLEFLLPEFSSSTTFLLEKSCSFFGCSMQLEVSTRKLKMSSSIAVVLQASQTVVVFYHFKFQLLALFQDFSG
jgi:hypothetical protein